MKAAVSLTLLVCVVAFGLATTISAKPHKHTRRTISSQVFTSTQASTGASLVNVAEDDSDLDLDQALHGNEPDEAFVTPCVVPAQTYVFWQTCTAPKPVLDASVQLLL